MDSILSLALQPLTHCFETLLWSGNVPYADTYALLDVLANHVCLRIDIVSLILILHDDIFLDLRYHHDF